MPQVVATDFFLKINAPVLAETPVTQSSPCYFAVSASLTDPLPYFSNCSLLCHNHYFILPDQYYFTSLVSWARSFTKPLPLETTSLLQRFTAESSWELMSSEEYRSALWKLSNKFLLFKLSSQLPFVSFFFLSVSILPLLPFSQSSLFSFSHFPWPL